MYFLNALMAISLKSIAKGIVAKSRDAMKAHQDRFTEISHRFGASGLLVNPMLFFGHPLSCLLIIC